MTRSKYCCTLSKYYCTIYCTNSTYRTTRTPLHGHLPGEPGLDCCLLDFFLHLFGKTLTCSRYFTDWMPFLLPKQHSQSTEGNSKHWTQPWKIIHWPHVFLIHQLTPETMDVMLIFTGSLMIVSRINKLAILLMQDRKTDKKYSKLPR